MAAAIAVESSCCDAASIFVSELPRPASSVRHGDSIAVCGSSDGRPVRLVRRRWRLIDWRSHTLVANSNYDWWTTCLEYRDRWLRGVPVGRWNGCPRRIGRPIAKFVCLLIESLCDTTAAVVADGRLFVDRQPTERIDTETFSSAATWPLRVPVRRHVRRKVTSSPRILTAQLSRPEIVKVRPIVEHTSSRSLNHKLGVFRFGVDPRPWTKRFWIWEWRDAAKSIVCDGCPHHWLCVLFSCLLLLEFVKNFSINYLLIDFVEYPNVVLNADSYEKLLLWNKFNGDLLYAFWVVQYEFSQSKKKILIYLHVDKRYNSKISMDNIIFD